jgi:hypothetical protein
MGIGKPIVDLEGALRGSLGLRKNIHRSRIAIEYQRPIRIRHRSIGRRVSWILLDRGLEQLYGFSFVRTVTPMQVEEAAEIVFVGFGINDVVSSEAGLFLRGDFQLDFINDGLRDFVLEAQRIPEIAFVTLGP